MTKEPLIISVHLPKSGGTSVRRCLETQFGSRALFDYGRGPLGPQALAVETSVPDSIQLIHGHFKPRRYASIKPAFWMTFLRQPTDLFLSFYFFWKTMPYQGGPLHRRFLDEQPEVEEFARWDPIRRLSSDTYFGGFDMGQMDFIGFHETRHEDMEKLNRLTGMELDGGRHENQTASGNEERKQVLSDSLKMARLRDILIEDVRFYEDLRAKRGS